MNYGVVIVPAVPVRKRPHHKFEMVNQLLFGETVAILKNKKGEWLKIKSLYDGYKGWVTHHMIREIEIPQKMPIPPLAAALLNTVFINGIPMQVPMGSFLWNYSKQQCNIGDLHYEFKGNLINVEPDPKAILKSIPLIAMQWLNAPYMWGGKTILGVDCSGFAQTVFKMSGVALYRDAWQQAQQGILIKKLQQAQSGDLAFFDDKEEIVHVGILLGPDKIIHASGKVRIDTIDKKGIINSETGVRTHQLKLIKRIAQLNSVL